MRLTIRSIVITVIFVPGILVPLLFPVTLEARRSDGVGAATPSTPARRTRPKTHTLTRTTAGYSAERSISQTRLSETKRRPLGLEATVKERKVGEGSEIVRTIMTDGPVENGHFIRTTKTLTVRTAAPQPHTFTPRWARRLINAYDNNKPQGVRYHRNRVDVRTWEPFAEEVYAQYTTTDGTQRSVRMTPDRSGMWEARLPDEKGAVIGQILQFRVKLPRKTPAGNGVEEVPGGDKWATWGDRYAQQTDATGRYSVFHSDKPFNWTQGAYQRPAQAPAAIHEIHVKDVTAHPTSPVRPDLRGTYLGLAQLAPYYRRMGGAVELLPVTAYSPIAGDREASLGKKNHWGYQPTFFLAPTVRYAQSPANAPQEFKSLVNAFHQANVPVIMDVVYNHIASDGTEHFGIGPNRGYYLRLDAAGNPYNGSGAGNELATEHPMVRRLVRNALRQWKRQYRVDGFRGDLLALDDKLTVHQMVDDLGLATAGVTPPAPSRRSRPHFFTGEPWSFQRAQWGKEILLNGFSPTGITLWNDDYRKAAVDFVLGGADEGARDRVMSGVAGSVFPFGPAARPSQLVNFLESHDEYAMGHLVNEDPQRAFMSLMLLLTSQGVPMISGGQEFLRTKRDNNGNAWKDSYAEDNGTNWYNWDAVSRQRALVKATAKLVHFRNGLPHFRYNRPLTDRDIQWLRPHGSANAIGYRIFDPERRKNVPSIIVLLNADNNQTAKFNLPEGSWTVVAAGHKMDLNPYGLRNKSGELQMARHEYDLHSGNRAVILTADPQDLGGLFPYWNESAQSIEQLNHITAARH